MLIVSDIDGKWLMLLHKYIQPYVHCPTKPFLYYSDHFFWRHGKLIKFDWLGDFYFES